jgi:molybdopterin-guanine dinucleotide biosynthesis protein A
MTAMAGGRPVTAVVLAGGAGRRLAAGGCNKAVLAVDGLPLLERVLAAAAPIAGSFVVVAAPGQHLPALDRIAPPVRIVRDSHPGGGPLPALADGLAAIRGDERAILLLSTDLAWLRTDLVRKLVDEASAATAAGGHDWIVPRIDGHPQVLVSCLTTRAVAAVGVAIADGSRSLRDLLTRVRVRWLEAAALSTIDPGLESFRDIDLPGDLPPGSGPDRPNGS